MGRWVWSKHEPTTLRLASHCVSLPPVWVAIIISSIESYTRVSDSFYADADAVCNADAKPTFFSFFVRKLPNPIVLDHQTGAKSRNCWFANRVRIHFLLKSATFEISFLNLSDLDSRNRRLAYKYLHLITVLFSVHCASECAVAEVRSSTAERFRHRKSFRKVASFRFRTFFRPHSPFYCRFPPLY